MLAGLGLSLVAAVLVSCSMGAVPVAPLDVLRVVGRRAGLDVGADIPAQQAAVVWSIRLPRIALAAARWAAGWRCRAPSCRACSATRWPSRASSACPQGRPSARWA